MITKIPYYYRQLTYTYLRFTFSWPAGMYPSWVVTRCLNMKTVILAFIANICLSGNGFDSFQQASQILQFGGQLKEKEMLCK